MFDAAVYFHISSFLPQSRQNLVTRVEIVDVEAGFCEPDKSSKLPVPLQLCFKAENGL